MLDKLKQLSKETNNFLQWRWDNPLHAEKPTEQQGRLWPSSEDFFHPLNPIFSLFIQKYEQMEFYKVFLLRDGAHTLLDFFLRFPVPKGREAQLLIPADLTFLAPDAWRPHLISYRMECPRPFKKTNRLLFYALVSDTFLSWPKFQFQMKEWLQQFPKDASVSAFFATRNEPLDHRWVDKITSFEFMSIFQSHFKQSPELLNFEEFKGMLTKSDITYINMDLWHGGTGLCSVDNVAFSQAVQVFPRATYKGFTGKKIGEWPMSFQHKLTLYTTEAKDSDYSSFMFMKKMSPATTISLPHPIVPTLYDLLAERLTFE